MSPAPATVDAIIRALRIIESLAQSDDGANVTDLAEAEKVNKALTHRALASLVDAGYAEQDPISARYRLTGRLLAVALTYFNRLGFQNLLTPIMHAVAEKTRCAAEYTRNIDGVVRILISVQPAGGIAGLEVASRVGDVQAAHATAAGKIWLAHLAPKALDGFLTHNRLERRTRNTIVTRSRLREEIERVRRMGYAFNRQESADWVFAVAVPIITPDGSQFLGAVGLVRPQASRRADDEASLVEAAQSAAADMAQVLPPWADLR